MPLTQSAAAQLAGMLVGQMALDRVLLARAARLFAHNRIRRETLWRGERTSEPFWDLLLELFVADMEDRRLSISSLGLDAGIAPTTVIRKVAEMESAGLVERMADPADRRRSIVTITPTARTVVAQWVLEAARDGLTMLLGLLAAEPQADDAD